MMQVIRLLATYQTISFFILSTYGECQYNPCGVNTICDDSRTGTAVCRCQPGYDHAPHGNTIDGCPINIRSSNNPTHRTNIRSGNPCNPNPCGNDAQCEPVGERPLCTCPESYSDCESNGNRAICKCLPGFEGDPYVRCNDNPCNKSPCGANAVCENVNARASCKCRPNYEGDPFVQCTLDPCLISPCGINADCEKSPSNSRTGISSTRAICKCREGYEGDPFERCNLNPCHDNPCGANADCSARSSSAVCRCIEGYIGDPFSNCELDPCSNNPCGQNAECTSRGRSSVCKCPRGFSGDPYSYCDEDPCANNPCGTNAECKNRANRPICNCPSGFIGDPHISCSLDPCKDNDACGLNTECEASGTRSICKCRSGYSGSPYSSSGCRSDPCSTVDICGINAECRNQNDRPVCECLPNHKGDPYIQCFLEENAYQIQSIHVVQKQNAKCKIIKYALLAVPNTDCEVSNDDQPICKCKTNFIGNPITGCRYECETDRECSNNQHQCVNKRCQPACRDGVCGENANCLARNNKPICSCPENFLGDPYSRCYTECINHSDCQDNRACVLFRCKNPCSEPNPNVCGVGADCEAKSHKAICSCPRGFTGDPFVSCREFNKQDLCKPDPCGDGALCQPGTDRSGNSRPVCTCPQGYRGDPLTKCVRGECENDNECTSNQACFDFKCKDPCTDACGINSECRALNHGAICSCRSGYVGNPLEACRESQSNSPTVAEVGFDLSPNYKAIVRGKRQDIVKDGRRAVILLQLYAPITMSRLSTPPLFRL
ncbi:unnamed protein product [Lepeophtheirus salmonis]|uniref:(salmon louse) hypothetical protein n=1 Tax=Lepeophtheirus salmonis TaxID=72036 RepID=A0A7R8CJY7_LEPSM|nr:unnamed protein product [Lepeophtheirus salmonis]CAF2816088.1 unnamed protein product [Lepeophtheirus salmonis]